MDADSKNDDLPLPLTSYSKPIGGKNDENSSSAITSVPSSHDTSSSGESNTSDNENDFSSSLERLLAEREQKNNPIQPSPLTVNANRNNDGSVPEQNFNDFMTMSSPEDKQVINFPKDKTNPCNRLQLNPDDEEQTERRRESGSGESLEIGNRQNFPGSSSNSQQQQQIDESAELDAIKDAVPTVDLTMKIIQQSRWNDENVIFSPLSIANVLSMLLLGAGGETFKVGKQISL